MKKLLTTVVALALLAIVAPAMAQWVNVAPDPSLWPYADGPPVEPLVLPQLQYRLGGAVGPNPLEGGEVQLYAVGGISLTSYTQPVTLATYWGNRQSHFSIYSPGSDSWVSADGTDDTPVDPDGIPGNGDEYWTSVGLCGYNNGNGTNSPMVGEGAGYISDQAFYYNNAVYSYGGYPRWGGTMDKYDIVTNSWSVVPKGSGSEYMSGGAVVGTSWYRVEAAGSLMEYDLTTDTWVDSDLVTVGYQGIPIAGLVAPQFGAAGAAIGGKLYVLDTYDAAGDLYEIDPIAATVTTKKKPFIPVGQAGSVVWNGKLYILGGRKAGGGDSATEKIQIYDPATDTWAFGVLVMPDKRSGFLAEVIGDTLYIGNGYSAGGFVIDDLQKIDMNLIGSQIPEPGTMVLFGFGLLALLGLRRRK